MTARRLRVCLRCTLYEWVTAAHAALHLVSILEEFQDLL